MQSPMKRRIAFGLTTGGLLAGGGLGFAHADSTGTGSGNTGTTAGGSPGILSGNTIQVPVDIPINVCGVTASVVGLLNPAAHNSCSNEGGATATGGSSSGSTTPGGSTAIGGAQGSPGILSGNNVQVPVNVPVNVCGDTVNVIGIGDAAVHNHCSNEGGATASGGSGSGSSSGSTAIGGAQGSPGILSGNNVQIPVNVPVNVCGDSVNVVGIGDAAVHNHCRAGGGAVVTPPPATPPATPPSTTPPFNPSPPTNPATPGAPGGSHSGGSTGGSNGGGSQPGEATGALAHTGADGLMLAPVGAAMIGGGAFLYRKFKPRSKH